MCCHFLVLLQHLCYDVIGSRNCVGFVIVSWVIVDFLIKKIKIFTLRLLLLNPCNFIKGFKITFLTNNIINILTRNVTEECYCFTIYWNPRSFLLCETMVLRASTWAEVSSSSLQNPQIPSPSADFHRPTIIFTVFLSLRSGSLFF